MMDHDDHESSVKYKCWYIYRWPVCCIAPAFYGIISLDAAHGEMGKGVDLERGEWLTVESRELLGSEGAAAENKALKRQMQWGGRIHLVSPLCRCAGMIKAVGRKIGCKQASIWASTQICALALHKQKTWPWRSHGNENVYVILFLLLLQRAMKTKLRNVFAEVRGV